MDKQIRIKFLELIYENSRLKDTTLAQKLHVSRQTIGKIRAFFWDKEYISAPTILLNPHKLNLQYFFMEIKTNPSEPQILDQIQKIPQVQSIDGILGEYSLIVQFRVHNRNDFASIIEKIDQSIAQSQFQSYRVIEAIDVYKIGGFPINKSKNLVNLRATKWKILNLLEKNLNFRKWPERSHNEFFSDEEKEFLQKINLTREFDYFQKRGIIRAYTFRFKPQIHQFRTKFYLRIKPHQLADYPSLARQLQKHPNIHCLFRTGEDAGLLAIVRTDGLSGFRSFIQNLYKEYRILNTHTTVVVDEQISAIFPPTLEIANKISKKKIEF